MRKTYLLAGAVQVICTAAIAAPAEAAAAPQQAISIPAGDLKSALDAYVQQTGRQLIYRTDKVRGVRSPGAHGNLSPDAALTVLLQGTGFAARTDSSGAIAIVSAEGNAAAAESAAPLGTAIQTQSAATADGAGQIVVTGTRIRGGRAASPVITIGSKQIREEGFTDLGEVIRSIPQNFSGGQNPGVSVGNISGAGLANQNLTGGSGLNLRGLGPDATLTLLNGRRLAYGGFVQSVDISAIPVEAVDRIEIVPDGASAIYGSDAVGGVANVILKRDFQGVTIGGRVGGATDGGLGTHDYTGTAGTKWSSGGVIATFEDSTVKPIYARQRSYADFLIDPTTLYPGSKLRSGLLSAHQQLGEAITLRLDALRTRRDQDYGYYLGGMNDISSRTTTTFVAPSVEISLPGEWTASLGGAWGKDDHLQYQTRTNVTTGASTIVSNHCFCNKSRSYEVNAEGPLFALPGGDARLAIGGGYRRLDFQQFERTAGVAAIKGSESARFAYAEMNLPLVGPQTHVAGVERLALSAAVRAEDYDSFGTIATPKVGVVYEPSADIALKGTWGRSFKAPTLFQRYWTKAAYLYDPAPFGGSGFPAGSTVLVNWGGNTDLKPERATTWSATLAIHPTSAPAFQAELTGFYIDYVDRVVQPVANSSQALSNPIYAQFIDFSPTPEQQAKIIAGAAAFYNFSSGAYDPANVAAIINLDYLNAVRQKIKGVDLSGSYRLDLGTGRMTIRGSLSLLDSTQQAGAAQKPYHLAGTLFNPPKLSARLGAVWDRRGLSASVFLNYKGGVKDLVTQKTTSSFTTADAALRYTTAGNGALSGLSFALSAQNLFDRAPPLYTPTTSAAYAVPYDSTNYSAIGRFVSLSVSKHF
jgi:outer membrane receptor protein involved in Fe transport